VLEAQKHCLAVQVGQRFKQSVKSFASAVKAEFFVANLFIAAHDAPLGEPHRPFRVVILTPRRNIKAFWLIAGTDCAKPLSTLDQFVKARSRFGRVVVVVFKNYYRLLAAHVYEASAQRGVMVKASAPCNAECYGIPLGYCSHSDLKHANPPMGAASHRRRIGNAHRCAVTRMPALNHAISAIHFSSNPPALAVASVILAC